MDTYLKHYGVKGMKWGVRRYQNPDGTYTKAGKERNAKKVRRAYEIGGATKLRKNKEFVKAADRVKKSRKAVVDAVDNLDAVAFGIMNEKGVSSRLNTASKKQKQHIVELVCNDKRYMDALAKRYDAEDAYNSACGDVVTALVGRYGDESVRRPYYGSRYITIGQVLTSELYRTALTDLYPSGRTNKRFDELYEEAWG